MVEARRIIAEETGIPADNVMISATHTHTGPTVLGISAVADLVAGNNNLRREYFTRQAGRRQPDCQQRAGP